jgi:hypothetical protein
MKLHFKITALRLTRGSLVFPDAEQLDELASGKSAPSHTFHANGVARAFVPPAQNTPFAFQYSERSPAMFTPFVTSIRTPNDSF